MNTFDHYISKRRRYTKQFKIYYKETNMSPALVVQSCNNDGSLGIQTIKYKQQKTSLS